MENALNLASSVLELAGTEITGYDGLIACLIIGLVEYGIKIFFKSSPEKTWNIVARLSPIALGLITYIVIAVIQKTNIVTGAIHGLSIGLIASGCYSSFLSFIKAKLKALKEKGLKELENINEEGKKILEENK